MSSSGDVANTEDIVPVPISAESNVSNVGDVVPEPMEVDPVPAADPVAKETKENTERDTTEKDGEDKDATLKARDGDAVKEEAPKPEAAAQAVKDGKVTTDDKPGAEKSEDTTGTAAAAEEKAAEKPVKEGPKYLDLAFAMDCTGSMSSYIHKAQQSIRTIVEEIVSKESADVRLALVQYRDHPPQDSSFVTHTDDFTESVRKMKGWLDTCSANGGGDCPEAVADALHQVLKLSWREESTKICVFIADAPPHGLGGAGDGFPNGCPAGLDPMEITNQLAEKGVMIYMVGCEPSITPYMDFFMALTHMTGGQYVPLAHAKVLPKVIIGGAQEEISLEQLRQDINQDVLDEFQALGGEAAEDVDLEAVSRKIHSKWASKGARSKQLHMNKTSLPEPSAYAKNLTSCPRMEDVRREYAAVPGHIPAPRASSFAFASAKAPARKSKKKSSGGGGGGGGLFGGFSLGGWFGKSKADDASTAAPGAEEDEDDEEYESAPAPMMEASLAAPLSSAPMATATSSYDVVEDDLCYEQTSRMVSNAVFKNQMQSKVKKAS